MATFFIKSLLKKKQQKQKRLHTIIICSLIFAAIIGIMHIAGVFILKYAVKNTLDNLTKNDTIVTYKIHSNMLNGNITIKDANFQVPGGSTNCETIEIKKISGFFMPTKLNVKLHNLTSTAEQTKKKYTIQQHGNEDGFCLKLKNGLFKLPSFKGIRISSPVTYIAINDDKNIGELRLDEFAIEFEGDKKETKYKGTMIFHDATLLPYMFMLDVPLKWDLHMQEFKTKEYIGFDNTKTVEVNNVKLNKFFFDLDFASFSAKGNFSYSSKLHTIDLEIDIDNDEKFIDNIFNMALRKRSDAMQQIKKTHLAIKKIVPILKKNSEKSTQKQLQLIIKKTNLMPNYTINDISLTDLISNLHNTTYEK